MAFRWPADDGPLKKGIWIFSLPSSTEKKTACMPYDLSSNNEAKPFYMYKKGMLRHKAGQEGRGEILLENSFMR